MKLEDQIAALKAQIATLTARADEHGQAISRIGQDVHVHEQQLRPVRGAPLVNRKQADLAYGPQAMRQHLGAGGEAPLPLAGLRGAAGEPQPARIPEVPALPQLGDPNIKQGTVVHHEGANFRRGKTTWEKL